MLRFVAGLALGLAAGAGLVTFYWWLSDQQQADALEGWEWQPKVAEPAEGTRELFLPGEMEWNAKRDRLERGIPMLTSIVDDLERLAADLGLDGKQLLGI